MKTGWIIPQAFRVVLGGAKLPGDLLYVLSLANRRPCDVMLKQIITTMVGLGVT